MNRVRLLLSAAAFAAVAFFGAGCNDGSDPVKPNTGTGTDSQPLNVEWKMLKDGSSDVSLAGTSWYWEGLERILMAEPSRFGDKAYSLEFKENGALVVYTWINEYEGTYTVESRGADEIYKINIADFYGTEPISIVETYENYWRNSFLAINSFSLSGNDMTLYYNNGNDSLVYRQFVPSTCLGKVGLFKKNCGPGSDSRSEG